VVIASRRRKHEHRRRRTSRPAGDPQPDLILLGAGVSFPEHLTVQTIGALTKCAVVLTNVAERQLGGLPVELRVKCRSVCSLYHPNERRIVNYRRVVRALAREVTRRRPVAWLTWGHPIVFDTVSDLLLRLAREKGWTVRVLPGVSSLDTILADLAYDPANGLFVYGAADLVVSRVPLVPSVSTVLLQPAVFGIDRANFSRRERPDLSGLRDYLLLYYSAVHRCALIHSADAPGAASHITWLLLSDLPKISYDMVVGATMFIPPLTSDPQT
jgi:hypothetical protein